MLLLLLVDLSLALASFGEKRNATQRPQSAGRIFSVCDPHFLHEAFRTRADAAFQSALDGA